MENKYYQPDVSEFHVGFEYEYSDTAHNLKDIVWEKSIFQHEDNLDYIITGLQKKDWIRVKLLNKKDCESLGWSYDNNAEPFPTIIDQHGHCIAFVIDLQMTPSDTCWNLYLHPDQFCIIDRVVKCGSGIEDMMFRGYIKNKSELKKLMQQIGII